MCRWLFLVMSILLNSQVSAETVHIAAAANMRYVLPAIIANFNAEQNLTVAVTYAASGNLSNQIRHGAPYQIFLSADAESIAPLLANKLNSGAPFSFADGQLVLYAKHDAGIQLDLCLDGLKHYLQGNSPKKIAIANPQHAPYGRAAKRYMQQHKVWLMAEQHLIQAENASQLTQFTLTGDVALGFIPLSHALQPAIRRQGHYVTLPVILHQQGILTKRATSSAEKFVDFLKSEIALQHFLQHGFVIPGVP